MNLLRSITRRGFTVAQAGYFTVTSPNRWFPASRLPGDFPELIARPKIAGDAATKSNVFTAPGATLPASKVPPPQFELIGPRVQNHRLLRLALTVLAAATLTLVGLWAAGDTPSLIHWNR